MVGFALELPKAMMLGPSLIRRWNQKSMAEGDGVGNVGSLRAPTMVPKLEG